MFSRYTFMQYFKNLIIHIYICSVIFQARVKFLMLINFYCFIKQVEIWRFWLIFCKYQDFNTVWVVRQRAFCFTEHVPGVWRKIWIWLCSFRYMRLCAVYGFLLKHLHNTSYRSEMANHSHAKALLVTHTRSKKNLFVKKRLAKPLIGT